MGTCKYCGLSAGLFSHAHKECEEKHKQGIAELLTCLRAYFNWSEEIGNLLNKTKSLQSNYFLNQEDLEDCYRRAIKLFADTVRLPITKQHIQIVDTFLSSIKVPLSVLNKNGELDALGTRFYQGVLMSYFAENEPMTKVEKRAQIISRVLPISSSLKENAGLIALQKAAHKYLSDGLITDSEQARLDEFSSALSLPVNNLPADFRGTDIEKVQQAAILRQIQRGQMPAPLNISLPIMLSAGEYIIWEYPNVTMYQEKIVKEWVGRSSGWSYRVMKGVYYRTGSSKGHPVEHSTMEPSGTGSLILTNKNIIFYSSMKSAKIAYKKLIGVTPYSDGVELQKDGANAKRQVFQGFDSWFMMNLLSSINI